MPHYKSDPRQITARFQSTCPETGKTIKKGDDCIYYPRHRKAYHVDSKQAQSFREWQFDNNVLSSQY